MKIKTSPLEIRIHGVRGTVETFIQPDAALADRIFKSVKPARLFAANKVVIAGTYSLTAFVPARLTRIDFIAEGVACWKFPVGISDLIELSEDEFREHAHRGDPEHSEKRDQRRVSGDLHVGFLEIEMVGGQHVFLGLESLVELPAERLKRVNFLLSAPSLHFRLRQGGIGVLNLGNLARFTAYPGPSQAPADAWPAHHKKGLTT